MGYFTDTIDDAYQSLNEGGWGVDGDSTNLKKIRKWYSKFVTDSKSKADQIELIDERLEVLRKCSKNMKQTLTNSNGQNTSEMIKYALKSFIPFNDIARLIAKQDAYAGLRILTDMLLPGVGIVVKTVNFNNMLNQCIKDTDEAIEYLEKKRKELK